MSLFYTQAAQYAEVILFTSDPILLERLAFEVDRLDAEQIRQQARRLFETETEVGLHKRNDQCLADIDLDSLDNDTDSDNMDEFEESLMLPRPATAPHSPVVMPTSSNVALVLEPSHPLYSALSQAHDRGSEPIRPHTAALGRNAELSSVKYRHNLLANISEHDKESDNVPITGVIKDWRSDKEESDEPVVCCTLLRLNIRATHGDEHFVGLTSLAVLDDRMCEIPLTMNMLDAYEYTNECDYIIVLNTRLIL